MCPFAWKIESLCVAAEQKQYMTLINLAIPPVFAPITDRKDKRCAMQELLLPSLSRWNLLLFVHLHKRRFAEKKNKLNFMKLGGEMELRALRFDFLEKYLHFLNYLFLLLLK